MWHGDDPLAALNPVAPDATQKSLRALAGSLDDRPILKHLSDDIGYLRLPTFSKEHMQIVQREQPSWEPRSGAEHTLIVDLRNNDGGDAAFQALRGWVDASELEANHLFTSTVNQSCLYPGLKWGYVGMSASQLVAPLNPEMRSSLQYALNQLVPSGAAPSRESSCEPHFATTHAHHDVPSSTLGRSARVGKPRLLVVVNEACGSDCELMAGTLAKLPEATLVGVNTYGVAQYIQPGYSALPNTRMPFRIALGTSDMYGDGRSVDGYGLQVDIVLRDDAAWSKEALIELAQLLHANPPPALNGQPRSTPKR